MKNWEKYEKEITKIGIGNLAISKGAPANCKYIPDCSLCDFSSIKGCCDKKIIEWLYQEAEWNFIYSLSNRAHLRTN